MARKRQKRRLSIDLPAAAFTIFIAILYQALKYDLFLKHCAPLDRFNCWTKLKHLECD